MAKAKRRIFNYRPMVLAALALIVGIIVAEALYGEKLALISIPLCVGVAALVLLLVFKKTRRFFYIPLIMLVGFSAMSISGAVYDSKMSYKEYSPMLDMTATVSGMMTVTDEGVEFYVHDLYVDGEKMDYDATVHVYFDFTPDFNAGDVVSMRGYVQGTEHKKFDGYFANAIASGRAYYLHISEISKLSEGELDFPRNLQHKIRSAFYKNMDSGSASICTALLLGDKFGMDDELRQGVTASGLSHVLAVSGLHITTLSTALYFILRKLKVKPWVSLIIVVALTFLYTALCSFTASALRAFVMSAVFAFASSFGKKRDNLSALSFAAILILIFRPTALFEAGFLLSFSSMLGIFLFHRSLNEAGQKAVCTISPKHKFGSRIVKLACVTLSATIMSYPFQTYFFGQLPLLQLLSNLIFVPYVMLCYVVLLPLTLISLATSVTPVLYVMQILLFPFKHYVEWAYGLTRNLIGLPAISVAAIVAYLMLVIFISRFALLPRKDKLKGGLIGAASAVAICAAFALI